MSKAGYPYDNVPMERYFNTLKNECTNLYEFETEEALYQKVEDFAYVDHNHARPHSYNGYRTPYEAWMAAQLISDIFSHKCYKMQSIKHRKLYVLTPAS